MIISVIRSGPKKGRSTRVTKKRIKCILSVLEKRGYIAKGKDSNKYMLSRKILPSQFKTVILWWANLDILDN